MLQQGCCPYTAASIACTEESDLYTGGALTQVMRASKLGNQTYTGALNSLHACPDHLLCAEASPGRWATLFRKLTPAKDKVKHSRTSLFRRKAAGTAPAPALGGILSPGSLCLNLVAQPIAKDQV